MASSTSGGDIEIYKIIDYDCDYEAVAVAPAFHTSPQHLPELTSEPVTVAADNTDISSQSVLAVPVEQDSVNTVVHDSIVFAARGGAKLKTGSRISITICTICSVAVGEADQLEQHMVMEHGVSVSGNEPAAAVKCANCFKYFTHSSYQHHIEECHVFHRHCCEFCGKSFKLKASLAIHSRVHDDSRKPYWCCVCGKKFSQNVHMKEHLLSHGDVKPYECSTCSQTFSHLTNLYKHERTIHKAGNAASFDCEICGQKFSEQGNLYKHMGAIHSSDCRWSCSECGMSFKYHGTLKTHLINRHNMIIGHECSICHKRFSCISRLRDHSRKHTGERPFTCSICFQKFSFLSAMKKHKRLHETNG